MKKIALAMLAASALFATDAAYNYEITPTIGGAHPEGNLDLNEQMTYGLRFARNLNELFFSQFEVGFDYSHNVKESVPNKKVQKGAAQRYYANLVKNVPYYNGKLAGYVFAGAGYENLPKEFIDNKNYGFGQYGAGLRYQMTDRFALKVEVRDQVKFKHADHHVFYTLGLGIGLGEKAPKTMPVEHKHEEMHKMPEPKVMPMPEPKVVPLDDDNDGVLNDADKCPNTRPGAVVDEHGCEKVIVLRDLDVNFATNSYAVGESYAAEIKKVAEFMKTNSEYKVELAGHTDSIGKASYNQKLSEKRAEAVAKVLVEYGVQKDKISTIGYGETKPVATNDTAAGRAQNRRVEATFSK